MTEAEWKTARDAGPLIRWLGRHGRISWRKARLFYVALARANAGPHLGGLLDDATEVAELPRGATATRMRRDAVHHDLRLAGADAGRLTHACTITGEDGCPHLVRELFGNPFRPVRRVSQRLRDRVRLLPPERRPRDLLFVNEWLTWAGGLVVRLAEGVVADRAFDRMPVLGDALEDAGCDEADVLEHCRSGGPHAVGCWVLDLILGKE